MSSKINIFSIIKGHASTLSDSSQKLSIGDIFTFYLVPFTAALIMWIAKINLDKDVCSLLVNFGSIFTALLLSVLVLVYDQEVKLQKPEDNASATAKLRYKRKKTLLSSLYHNISYSIIIALLLVLISFIHSLIGINKTAIDASKDFSIGINFTTPLLVFITTNLFLTIIMIVKRLHVLLINQD